MAEGLSTAAFLQAKASDTIIKRGCSLTTDIRLFLSLFCLLTPASPAEPSYVEQNLARLVWRLLF